MTPLMFNYIQDISEETRELAKKSHTTKFYCNHITLPCSAFSPTGSEFLSVVSAKKGKMNSMNVIRFGVLTCAGGITVTVPYQDELVYMRYRSLIRYMRNLHMYIAFPNITINYGAKGFGLYFTSTDFKMKSPDAPVEPSILI